MRTRFLALAVLAGALAAGAQQSQRPGPLQEVPPTLRLDLEMPVRAALTPSGELWVTDYVLRRVCKVEPSLRTYLDSFPVIGQPTALGIWGGRLYVGNETAQRVEIYGFDGQLQGTLGGPGFVVGDPRDLEIDATTGRLYVVDGAAREVKVFDLVPPGGQYLRSIGAGGTGVSDFQNPTGIALDASAQQVLVGDFGPMSAMTPPRVLVFGTDGTFHTWISGKGGPSGQYFARPQGMLIGSSGNLFIVDSWRGEVVVMNRSTSTQVGVLGAYGRGTGKLLLPLDLVVYGANQDLYVTSSSSHRVERFDAGGQL